MGYKNRYLFAKRTYQETIILFKVNNKYLSYLDTLSFLKYLKFHNKLALLNKLNKLNINYIIINNNMQIIKLVKFKENKYKLYYKKFVLFKILEEIKEMIT